MLASAIALACICSSSALRVAQETTDALKHQDAKLDAMHLMARRATRRVFADLMVLQKQGVNLDEYVYGTSESLGQWPPYNITQINKVGDTSLDMLYLSPSLAETLMQDGLSVLTEMYNSNPTGTAADRGNGAAVALYVGDIMECAAEGVDKTAKIGSSTDVNAGAGADSKWLGAMDEYSVQRYYDQWTLNTKTCLNTKTQQTNKDYTAAEKAMNNQHTAVE